MQKLVTILFSKKVLKFHLILGMIFLPNSDFSKEEHLFRLHARKCNMLQ